MRNWEEPFVATDANNHPDVREVVRQRAEQIAQEKNVPFGEALNELKLREPGLIKKLADYYSLH